MDPAALALGFAAGALAGGLVAGLLVHLAARVAASSTRERLGTVEAEREGLLDRLDEARDEVGHLRGRIGAATAELEAERRAAAEKVALLETAEDRLVDAFDALSARSLDRSNARFLDLAREAFGRLQEGAGQDLTRRQEAIGALLNPVRDSLARFEARVGEVERARVDAYAGLVEQVKALGFAQESLRGETTKLSEALRAPNVRGRWAEIQLERVAQLAGLAEHCDFTTQKETRAEDGRLRPDMVVHLPDGKKVVVDAKAPMSAYLDAQHVAEPERTRLLREHARRVREHARQLAKRRYAEGVEGALAFVVLFLPHEAFLSAAIEQDPSLIEQSFDDGVIITTPATLVALLKSVAYGWRQLAVEANALVVQKLGAELYERIAGVADHFAKLGQNLDRAVDSYNRAVGTLERRVLPTVRRLDELKVTPPETKADAPPVVTAAARRLQAPEMLAGLDGAGDGDAGPPPPPGPP